MVRDRYFSHQMDRLRTFYISKDIKIVYPFISNSNFTEGVELHGEGSAHAACAAGFFVF